MAKFDWSKITKEDVIKAIEQFDRYNPEHPEPRSTFLLYDGKKYPAKHIRGMSYKIHYGEEISKSNFTGGQETARFFERLGFDVQYTHKSVNTHPVKTSKAKTVKYKPEKSVTNEPVNIVEERADTNAESTKKGKITIPSKGVIEQKNALQLILNKICDGDIVCEKTFPWMKTPEHLSGEYAKLYENLSSYRGNKDFAKKNVTLRCDFVCESKKLIIEYDERQHFSEARRVSVCSYTDVDLDYNRELWIRACEDIQAKDKHPADRDEVRAYYDSTRDIEAARHALR